MRYFCQQQKYRRTISHDAEKRSKLSRKTDFLFEKLHEKFGEFNAGSGTSENFHFDGILYVERM